MREASNSYNPIVVDDMMIDARDDDVIDLTSTEVVQVHTSAMSKKYIAVHNVEQIRAMREFQESRGIREEDELIEVESTTSSAVPNYSDYHGPTGGPRIEEADSVRVIGTDDPKQRPDPNMLDPYRLGEIHNEQDERHVSGARTNDSSVKPDSDRIGISTEQNRSSNAANLQNSDSANESGAEAQPTMPHTDTTELKKIQGYERFGNKYRRAVAHRKAQEKRSANSSSPTQKTLWTRPLTPTKNLKPGHRDSSSPPWKKPLKSSSQIAVGGEEIQIESIDTSAHIVERAEQTAIKGSVTQDKGLTGGDSELSSPVKSKRDQVNKARSNDESNYELCTVRDPSQEEKERGPQNEGTPITKEISDRRLKVLEKARALLSSPKASVIKEMNEKRRAAAEEQQKESLSDDEESQVDDESKGEDPAEVDADNVHGMEPDASDSVKEYSKPPCEPDGNSIQELMNQEADVAEAPEADVIEAQQAKDKQAEVAGEQKAEEFEKQQANAVEAVEEKAETVEEQVGEDPPTSTDGASAPALTNEDSDNVDFYNKLSKSLFKEESSSTQGMGHLDLNSDDKEIKSNARNVEPMFGVKPSDESARLFDGATTYSLLLDKAKLATDKAQTNGKFVATSIEHHDLSSVRASDSVVGDTVEIHGIPLTQAQLGDKRSYALPATSHQVDPASLLRVTADSKSDYRELAKSNQTQYQADDQERVTAFDRLRETLMQLDVAASSSSSEELVPQVTKVVETRTSPKLPIHPILSDYSQDLAYSYSNADKDPETHFISVEDKLEVDPSLQAYSRLGEATRHAMIAAESQVLQQIVDSSAPQHHGILKNANEEAHVHFEGTEVKDSVVETNVIATTEEANTFEMDNTTHNLGKADGSRFTPKELDKGDTKAPVNTSSHGEAIKKKNGLKQVGKKSSAILREERIAEESDGNTMDDTESKISLISYLGSEDSDLDTNFESSTVPMIVKMLDRGCAWLEGNNCGFESPSLLRESKGKTTSGGNGKHGLLPQSTNFPSKSLGRKKSALAQRYNQSKKAAENAAQLGEKKTDGGRQDKEPTGAKATDIETSTEQENQVEHEADLGTSKIEEIRAAASGSSPNAQESRANLKEEDQNKNRSFDNSDEVNSAHKDSQHNQGEHGAGLEGNGPVAEEDVDTPGLHSESRERIGMTIETKIDLTDDDEEVAYLGNGSYTNDPPENEPEEQESPDPPGPPGLQEQTSPTDQNQSSAHFGVDPAPSRRAKSTDFDETHQDHEKTPRSKGAVSSIGRKAGGPESPSRHRRSKSPPKSRSAMKPLKSSDADETSIDPQMFVNLTDEERLAALELAERLKRRAEKLKRRRKKREKRMRGRSSSKETGTFGTQGQSLATSAEMSMTA